MRHIVGRHAPYSHKCVEGVFSEDEKADPPYAVPFGSAKGPLTALAFVLNLEDPYRFERSRSVGAYLGLVPATDQSGERDPQKHIFRRRATRC